MYPPSDPFSPDNLRLNPNGVVSEVKVELPSVRARRERRFFPALSEPVWTDAPGQTACPVRPGGRRTHPRRKAWPEESPGLVVRGTPMKLPFGRYRGRHLQDSPRDYLLWLVHQDWGGLACDASPCSTSRPPDRTGVYGTHFSTLLAHPHL